jgi:hypothetical protein
MEDWRTQPQQRVSMNSIGPIHNYHSIRSRPSPYQLNEIKQTYQYQQSSTISVKTDSNSVSSNISIYKKSKTFFLECLYSSSLYTYTHGPNSSSTTHHPH